MSAEVKIIECPRDAMQGIEEWIPTAKKINYINQLMKVGFDTVDFGSFVSEKTVPQMRDTAEVLAGLDLDNVKSRLLAIVANQRGAESACAFDEIHYLGYPFSISETFQKRNTNASIEESLLRLEDICNLTINHRKELVLYISMGFGNPYGDPWNPEIAIEWSARLHQQFGIKTLALSDTIGAANPGSIHELFSTLLPALPEVEFGAHLHTRPDQFKEKLEAAYLAGCRRFDGAIHGFGGCPMAADVLTGNMPTELMVGYFNSMKVPTGLNDSLFEESINLASTVFPN